MNNQNQSGSIKLGFGLPPTPEYVYANRSKNCLWYFFRDEKVVAIEEPALTGYITGVDLVTVERYKADSEKLRIRVRADRQYVIEAGSHTAFAHGFLDAWSVMNSRQKAGAITIEVSPGEKPTVLFCSVFDESGTLIIPGKSGQALPAHDSGLAARVKFIIGLCCEGRVGQRFVRNCITTGLKVLYSNTFSDRFFVLLGHHSQSVEDDDSGSNRTCQNG